MNRREFLPRLLAPLAAGAGAAVAQSAAGEPASHSAIPFTLGLVTYNVAATWDLSTLLQVCKRVGISPVELRTTHKHGVEPSLSKAARREVRQRFADSGIEFWGCGSVCEFHAADPAVVRRQIETCKTFIDLVADLGGRGVKVRPNGLPRDVPPERTLDQIGRALAECGRLAQDAGIEIWVEVHGAGTALPHHMRTIMQQCGHSSVGITWNSNPTDLIGGAVEPAFDMLKPWLRSCHINDLYREHTGAYPYRRLFQRLRQSGYRRTTLIEVGRTYSDPAQGEEFLRYYKSLWTELAR